jgi:hypothetical protein
MPTSMNPAEAGRQLERALKTPQEPMTIADAAAKSGLPLRDAERGLHWLTKEYRGHIRVTNDGDLVFWFPNGFTKPWVVPSAMGSAARAVGRGVKKVAQYAVRAWITIVMLLYVLAFLAVIVALVVGSMAASGDRRDSKSDASGLMRFVGGVFRFMLELFIWSPYTYGWYGGYGYGGYDAYDTRRSRRTRARDDDENKGPHVPFHEKVNRWVFGPTRPPEDLRLREQAILAQIRAGKGRIGLADVMRVTGLPREDVDAMMARLMLDYDGEVDVSPEGGIAYRFEALRKTASDKTELPPVGTWTKPIPKRPLTGNDGGTNAMIVGLNAFNLAMGAFAFFNHITIDSLPNLARGMPLELLPQNATAWVLGVIPMLASLAILFAPLLRAPLLRMSRAKEKIESGRRAVTQAVLDRVRAKQPVRGADLARAWQSATGEPPDERTMVRVVASLGGDVDLDAADASTKSGEQVRYRFQDLELEARAVEAERAEAKEEEARLGPVVFGSDR